MAWKPTLDDYAELRAAQNPWQVEGAVPATLALPYERELAKQLWRRLESDEPRRFQVLLGPRRVGKTTAMYQTVARLLADGVPPARVCWLRLDHPLLIESPLGGWVKALCDHTGATTTRPIYLFLDELTYAESWDLWLKTFYDEQWPVRILASSSSSAALRASRVESGVGRWEEQYLPPWTFREYRAARGDAAAIDVRGSLDETIRANLAAVIGDQRSERRRWLLLGGFPELLLRPDRGDESSDVLDSQRILRNDAVQNAVYRDIPQAHGVAEPVKLERLLYMVAGQLGGIVSPTKLAASLQLAAPTIERYLAYLERTFVTMMVPNFATAEESVQRRGRKIWFCDGAVRNAALHRGLAPARDPHEMSALVENAVAAQLHALMQMGEGRLHYWRDGANEVEFVFTGAEAPIAFEVTISASHSRGGLAAIQERHPRLRGRCWLVSPDVPAMAPSPLSGGVGTLPLDLFLVTVGAQIEAVARRRLGVAAAPGSAGA